MLIRLQGLAFGWLFIMVLTAQAQVVTPVADTTLFSELKQPPRWVIKVTPLRLLEPDNAIEGAVERVLRGRHSLQGEFGYGRASFSLYPNQQSAINRENWRGRLEWRLYSRRSLMYRKYGTYVKAVPPVGTYWAFDVFYKQVNDWEQGSVGRECVGGNCAFFQRYETPVQKFVWAVHAKWGRQVVLLTGQTDRLLMDLYLGMGVRHRWVVRPAKPMDEWPGFDRRGGILDEMGEGSYTTPDLIAGFKLGYVF